MCNYHHPVTGSEKGSGATPAKKHASRSTPFKERNETQPGGMLVNQCESIFESLPESVIFCDLEGKLLYINAAALKLFEVPSEDQYRGASYQQFLQRYKLYDEQQQPISPESLYMNYISGAQADSLQETTLVIRIPSGRKVWVNLRCSPLLDEQSQTVAIISVFHQITDRYWKALRLQRVYEALLTLTEAIERIPEYVVGVVPEEMPLLSPPVPFVARQLLDLVRQVLGCHQVILLALEPLEDYLHYVAGSGFTVEQEQLWRAEGERLALSAFVDEAVIVRLRANQEVILSTDRLLRPLRFPAEVSPQNLLSVPLFLEQQLAGTLVVSKLGIDNEYTVEEIALVKAVVMQTMLVIESLRQLYEQAETQTRSLVQQEVQTFGKGFLTLATHELRTPLTGIMGNIQLAQRRLEGMKHQAAQQSRQASENIERIRQPLISASQSALLQQRIINDLIDAARIQTGQIELRMEHVDLLTLLREAVANQQRSMPERTIILKLPEQQSVPILADAERITQVINSYLANALNYSPAEQPVTVRLTLSDGAALVLVHDEGPGVSAEEHGLFWKDFYRFSGNAVWHDLDLSLGLGFYLCRALIEYHHGHVGVESDPGRGVTFWFTLPVIAPD